MDNEQASTLEPTWAVIELFGHTQIAGKLSTVTLGSACLLKVDVPETVRKEIDYGYGMKPDQTYEVRTPAYSRLLGVGAIYAINPCTEEIAVKMAGRIGHGEVARQTAIKTLLALPPKPEVKVEWPTTGTPDDLCICGHKRLMHENNYGCQEEVDGDDGDPDQCICEVFELQKSEESSHAEEAQQN